MSRPADAAERINPWVEIRAFKRRYGDYPAVGSDALRALDKHDAAIREAIGTTEKTRAEERFLRAACRARFDFYGAVKTTVEFRAAHGAMFGERLRAEARERGRKAK